MSRTRDSHPTPPRKSQDRQAAPRPRGHEMPPPLHEENRGNASQPLESGRNSGQGSEETRLPED